MISLAVRVHCQNSNIMEMFFFRLFFALTFNLVLFGITIVFTEVILLCLFYQPPPFLHPFYLFLYNWCLFCIFTPSQSQCQWSPIRWTQTPGNPASTGWASYSPASSTWTTQFSRWNVWNDLEHTYLKYNSTMFTTILKLFFFKL